MVSTPLLRPLQLRPWRNPLLPQLRLPHPLQLVPARLVLRPSPPPLRLPHLLPRRPQWYRTLTTVIRGESRLRPLLPSLHRPRNQRLPRRQWLLQQLRQRLMLD